MPKVDASNALSFLPENWLTGREAALAEAHAMLQEGRGPGSDFLGWVHLPENYDKEEYARIKAAAAKIRSDSQALVVIGIGGSYLGARAVIELLASDQLAKVVALARERYDYVIIDSPPLGFFSDSELLSDLSDASVLVVRQDTVPAPEINDAIDALRAGKAEFLGCILNDMSHLAAWSSGYGYGYGKKYDKYGYGQHSARKTQ